MDSKDSGRSLFDELKSAGWSWFAKWAVGLVVAYAAIVLALATVRLEFTQRLVDRVDFVKLGQFGDAFGAMTSFLNALALAAVVATIVLQSRELRHTRRQLTKQARATKQTAKAARAQIEQARALEFLKIRPLIRAEWFDIGNLTAELRVLNLGFGVAIVDKVEVLSGGEVIGQHAAIDGHELEEMWKASIAKALGNDIKTQSLDVIPLTDVNRAVAVELPTVLVRVTVKHGTNMDEVIYDLKTRAMPVVLFRSLAGEVFSTRTQFNLDFVGVLAGVSSAQVVTVG